MYILFCVQDASGVESIFSLVRIYFGVLIGIHIADTMLPRPISQRSTVYIKQEAAKGGQMFSSHFVPAFAKDM